MSAFTDISTAWRSFWHTMTSYDRHASHNSPYRTGQHVPLAQSHHSTLTSVATDAAASQTQLTIPAQEPPPDANGFIQQSPATAPGAPYSPGMRTTMQRRQSDDSSKTLSRAATGEIQMQNFNDGLPPPPPAGHSWKRIDRWCEDNYEELFDNICEGCTQNDINELEHELDCTLPMDVHESLKIHDGQERGGLPVGLIFGCMLLDCEEIVQEWRNWRTVTEEILSRPPSISSPSEISLPQPQAQPSSSKASSSGSATASPPPGRRRSSSGVAWREELLARQDSQPSGAVQKAYSHPAWIPLARDWGGNCIAVDLAPGPTGKWGQVILMGRDYDCKYVIAKSWATFLATLADDLGSPNVSVNEETGELKLLEFKHQGVEPAYIDILRWRADQKHGRKPPPTQKRRLPSEIRVNPAAAVASAGPARVSPYASPVKANGDKDGSPQRMPLPIPMHRKGSGGIASPRGQMSSPLARVAEESPLVSNVEFAEAGKQESASASGLSQVDAHLSTTTTRTTSSAATSNTTETNATQTNSTTRTSLGSNKENSKASFTAAGAGIEGLGMQNIDLNNRDKDDDDDDGKAELRRKTERILGGGVRRSLANGTSVGAEDEEDEMKTIEI